MNHRFWLILFALLLHRKQQWLSAVDRLRAIQTVAEIRDDFASVDFESDGFLGTCEAVDLEERTYEPQPIAWEGENANNYFGATLDQVGIAFGVGREGARQLIDRALKNFAKKWRLMYGESEDPDFDRDKKTKLAMADRALAATVVRERRNAAIRDTAVDGVTAKCGSCGRTFVSEYVLNAGWKFGCRCLDCYEQESGRVMA